MSGESARRELTAVLNAVAGSFCQDNNDQVQNVHKFGDSVPLAFVLVAHVLEAVAPLRLLECVGVLRDRPGDLPMHVKFLAENAAHFYLCSKAFEAIMTK